MTTLDKYRLSPTDLKRYTDADSLPDPSNLTDINALPNQDGVLGTLGFGQERAIKAINTALDIKANGYHVFAVGDNGLGKRTLITRLLAARAKHEPTPPDLVYVHNFDTPRSPIALSLPTATGAAFAKDMHKLWHSLYKKILAKFASLSYQNQLTHIKQNAQKQEHKLINALNADAKTHNLTLLQTTENKAIFAPIDENLPIDDAALQKLQKRLTKINVTLDELEETVNSQINELHDTLTQKIIEPLIKPLLNKYSDKAIRHHLAQYQKDVIENVLFIVDNDEEFMSKTFHGVPSRYDVNVIVSHEKDSGAPIVFEDMPTHPNLLGHIEYVTQLGTILTDASMIRAGALHKANGGYLLLEASSLLEHPYAWQGLKRALQSKQIKISSLEQMLTLTGSLSLAPDGVPLSVKVILLGEPDLYYELLEFEPEFNSLFKIRADFHDDVPRHAASEAALMVKMLDMIAKQNLPDFEKSAFAAILDELSVLADDQHKLNLHSDKLLQLLVESARQATLDGALPVNKSHVAKALQDMHERKSYLQELYWQEIKTGTQIINTKGRATGQINALTVLMYADSEFGMPARLTALIAPKFGSGEILDIERDVDLGGSLHAKGMLIMTSYLRSLFSEFVELNFSASLAFEQSYAHIDGDSATLAEACALLSALADVPVRQELAITGSMNQLGQAQAVGGVNAKIAGFFDACCEQGLSGSQGVILPRTNLSQLMLRDDIVQAVADGKFHIYAIDHIHQALALLTGIAIDEKTKHGEYKKSSLFGRILTRLASWDEAEEDEKSGKKADKKSGKRH
ncbi:peptidase S16 [Moraxella caviae]|uniref:endopeptidase La n=1 Tax=Moraxella caviae TaxID=34060 RepID=A0A1T0A5Q4_9GAMM|nr:ATP-binding protein [Moraxella caviae]OOR91065.1 peptidase S16 [Moraxella caviae]STZ14242.1 ATP-dependent protease Lon [Moraxella caviae]VEW13133.1 ATP-dependent protease Lon [Moraxella caviae]VEW13178.1 ATP-dependent protease Lon [Moraxella caviae]